jgi:hypothetical protein
LAAGFGILETRAQSLDGEPEEVPGTAGGAAYRAATAVGCRLFDEKRAALRSV